MTAQYTEADTVSTMKGSAVSGSKSEGKTRLSRDERNRMIAIAAYYKAEKRGFDSGHELEDWLAAEQEIAVVLDGVPLNHAIATRAAIPTAPSASSSAKAAKRTSLRL